MSIKKIKLNKTTATGWMIHGDYLGCSSVIDPNFFTCFFRYLCLWFKYREWRIARVQKLNGCPLND